MPAARIRDIAKACARTRRCCAHSPGRSWPVNSTVEQTRRARQSDAGPGVALAATRGGGDMVEAIAGRTRPRHRDVTSSSSSTTPASYAPGSKHFFTHLSVSQWLTESPQMLPVSAAARAGTCRPSNPSVLFVRLALARARSTRMVRRSQGALQQEGSAAARALSLPRLIEARRQVSIDRSAQTALFEKAAAANPDRNPGAHPTPPRRAWFPQRKVHQDFRRSPHIARQVVLRMDLKDFFPTFAAARIQTLFRTMGYPEPVADLLGGICTNAAPRDLFSGLAPDARALYTRPHLPQGAPASPALANLCTYRVDCRLSGLAESAGARYTRYADDRAPRAQRPEEGLMCVTA